MNYRDPSRHHCVPRGGQEDYGKKTNGRDASVSPWPHLLARIFLPIRLVVLAWLLMALPAVAKDRFRRVPASTNSTPPFSVQRDDSGWWLRSPAGEKFFSVGVCVFTRGATRESFDPENPGYAAWQHYESPRAWADASLRRLKSWGFNTAGGWSDLSTLRASPEQTLWLTPVLHIGSTAGAPWWDMWDEHNLRRMDEVARPQILAVRDDPRLLGYYSDNELGWWNATLWKMTFEQPPSSEQRQRLLRLLREHYEGDWKKLLEDFEPTKAENWTQLRRGGMLFLKPGGNGIRVMRQFLGLLAERYYQLMRDIIRRYDTRGLYLGDRYQSFFYPEVARASANCVDVASSNLNAQWNDGWFLRCYLDTLHALTGKPILVSEFYLAARDNRTGNRNSHGIYPIVATQSERATATRHTLHGLARLPYVVGADWFQFFDEPRHGREDGENFNFGLVDIYDRPYEELTAVFASLDAARLKGSSGPPRSNASAGVPRAPADPLANFEPGTALRDWDRERGFVKPSSEMPLADLYVSWNRDALYLGLYGFDIVEPAAYSGGSLPKVDRALWTVQINRLDPIRARIGAGREPLVNQSVRIENLSGHDLNVRNIAAMEIPARLLGQEAFRPGDTIELNVTFDTHARAHRVEWRQRLTLAD